MLFKFFLLLLNLFFTFVFTKISSFFNHAIATYFTISYRIIRCRRNLIGYSIVSDEDVSDDETSVSFL